MWFEDVAACLLNLTTDWENSSISSVRILCLAVLVSVVWHDAGAWGVLGHEAGARVAQTLLSTNTAARVERILGTNDLASVAVWADQVRDAQRNRGPLRNDPEVREFNRRFPNNQNWHYVNLPLGTLRYSRSSRFVSTNDIVHAMNRCVAVLEGRSAEMSKTYALRWLVHLVGDIHQPLHVGCGYYGFKRDGQAVLLRQPADALGRPHDLGGNILRFGSNQNLHAFWDVNLVDGIAGSAENTRLSTILKGALVRKGWKTSGRCDAWAAKWAAESVKEARGAYKGIKFKAAAFNGQGVPTNMVVNLPPGYESNQLARARTQLAKSAFHLAEILNKLDWE
jgi:hypothetical protein